MLTPTLLARANTLSGADKEWYIKTVTARPKSRNPPIETWTLIHLGIAQASTTNCRAPNFLGLYGYDIREGCSDVSRS